MSMLTVLVVDTEHGAFEEAMERPLGRTLRIPDPCGATGNDECLFKTE